MVKPQLDPQSIKAIESVLSKGDTAEVKPDSGGGVKVVHIQRTIVSGSKKKTK